MPASVKAAAARADEMILAFQKGQAVPETQESSPPEPQPQTTTDEPIQEPVAEGADGQDEIDDGVAIAQTSTHETQEPAAPLDTSDLQKRLDHAEQQYRSAQGRYKALQDAFNVQAGQIEQLNLLLANMQVEAPAKTEKQATPLVTKDDEEAYGADLIDLVRRAARDVGSSSLNDVLNPLLSRLEALESQVTVVNRGVAANSYERFANDLAEAVTKNTGQEFEAINSDTEFEAWVKGSPSRLKLFTEAVNTYDVEAALTFYELYAKQHMPQAPAPTPSTLDPRLSRQVQPGKSQSSSPSQRKSDVKRTWTRSEIAAFYQNKPRMPKDVAEQTDQEIFAAQREGRVDFSK